MLLKRRKKNENFESDLEKKERKKILIRVKASRRKTNRNRNECDQLCGVNSVVDFKHGAADRADNLRRRDFSAFSQVSCGPLKLHSKITACRISMK